MAIRGDSFETETAPGKSNIEYLPTKEGEMANWSMEEALRMALRLEAENFAEYEKSAAEATNPGVKSMFLFLADEERNHLKLIKEKMEQFNVKP
jgi:rubrerythrin